MFMSLQILEKRGGPLEIVFLYNSWTRVLDIKLLPNYTWSVSGTLLLGIPILIGNVPDRILSDDSGNRPLELRYVAIF